MVRLLAALTASALLVSGCSGSSSGGGSGDVTLEMWTFKQTHVKPLEAAAATFKQQTGITVKITAYTPDDTFKSKVMSAASTKNLADVMEVHAAGEDFVLGGAGILADLTDSVNDGWKARFLKGTADAGLVTDLRYQRSLQPKAADAGIKQGQLFSVPFTTGAFGIVYANKTKLTAAGLDPAKPPTTWADFISWLNTAQQKDPQSGGVTLGLKSSSTGFNWALQPLAYAYLGKERYQALFGKDSSRTFGSPDGQRVLALYDQLTPYWAAGTQTLGIDDADRAFAQGKSTFNIGGTFTLAALQQEGMKASDVLAFSVPAAADGAVKNLKLAPLALTGLSMSAQTKNPDAVVKWMDFLNTVDQAGAFAKASLDLPGVDLGDRAGELLGPDLAALQQSFGTPGPETYDAFDVAFQSPTYDQAIAGDALVKMSPLKQETPESTNRQLGTIIADSWK
ncbi:sugar ABC transporter substrate-binding protein [Kibdelosporangium aridum]|uniref:Sugar ABC transporter substrate-binding protein n=1 Tax=Kibdelosporangium aridum TaxID=2030 RepID=A0A428ZA80_KIBAR|nr:extracellular solute-binding protein [Kibdelosporangium aridum]RSM84975.1 sugar ABC transporter substrate-binding protein [Kibdelosporangium aridum]